MVSRDALTSVFRPAALDPPTALSSHARPTRPTAFLAAGLLLFLASGCDSISSRVSGPDAEAVVTGQVGELPGPAASASGAAASEADAEVATVVIGDVTLSGNFRALAEAAVDAQGRFRIEGVPTGRTNLIVSARTAAGAELGQVVLLEKTTGGKEHEVHPLDARSTLHARVWSEIQSAGSSSAPWMGPAELALFVDVEAGIAADLAVSQAVITAVAEGALAAEAALNATLGAQGMEFGAEARNARTAQAAIERDRARAAGAAASSTQQTFVTAALDAWIEAGIEAEAVATATAAAATALDQALANTAPAAHLGFTRAALVVNTEARAAVVASQPATALGLHAAANTLISELRSGIHAATNIQQLRVTVADAHAGVEGRVVAAATTALPDLPVGLLVDIEAALRGGVAETRLWTRFENATTPGAMAEAVADARAEAHARVGAILEALPANARAAVSADAAAALLIALGAGPRIG